MDNSLSRQIKEIVGEDDASIRDSLANEMAGLMREVRLQQKNWGFEIDTLSHIQWLHGKDDEQVPLAAVKHTLNVMTGVSLHTEDDLKHNPELQHWHKALAILPSST